VTALRSLNARAFAFFALLIQLLLPLGVPMAMTVDRTGGTALVICSMQDGGASHQTSDDPGLACRLCDAQVQAAVVLPPPVAPHIAVVERAEPALIEALVLPPHEVRPAPTRPRGPPLQA
jgi:hypothetical protein